jgi:hypothetical protein
MEESDIKVLDLFLQTSRAMYIKGPNLIFRALPLPLPGDIDLREADLPFMTRYQPNVFD